MKMLLGALGYDGEIEGFTGANWTVNVAKLALGVGLDDGNDDFSGNAYVTREQACLYAFNTLKADMVEYDSKTSVSIGGAEVVIAGSKAQVADQGVYENTMNEKGLQFAEKYFPKLTKTKNDTDPFGRPAAEWKYKSNVIGSYADYSDLLEGGTFTAKAKKGDLFSLVGSSVVNELNGDYDLTVYVDGAEVKDPAVDNYFNKNSSAAAGVSGNGVVTEVYMDDDNNVTIVQVNTYLVKATGDYNSSKGTLSFEVVDIDCDTVPALGNSIDNDDVNVESFKEDDYILVTYSYMDKAIESAELAEVVTGEVSEYTETSEVIIDGTTYKYNNLVGADVDGVAYTIGEDAKVVLDEYGYVIYVDEAVSTSSYVYIESEASLESSKTVKANAYFTDGTYGEITVKKIAGKTGASAMFALVQEGGWYTFSKDSADKYTLSTVKSPLTTATATVAGDEAAVVVTKNGKVSFIGDTATGQYDKDLTDGETLVNSKAIKGDSSTIFVVMDADDDVTTYTGVSNVPDITTSAGFNGDVTIDVVVKASTGYAKYVFIDVSADDEAVIDDANSAADYLFLLKRTTNKTTSGEDTYFKYKVVYDGVETEKYVEASLVENEDVGMLFRNIKENSKGYITKATPFDDAAKRVVVDMTEAGHSTISFSGDTLSIGGQDFIIGDKCNVTFGVEKAAHEDLIDEGEDYYLSQGSARSMANYVKDYELTGTAYVAVDDEGSQVATDIYVWVSSATYVGAAADEDEPEVPTGFSEEGGKIIYTIAADATAPTTLAMRNLVVDYVAATYELDLDSFAAAEKTEGSEATYTATFGGATVTVEVVKAAE